MAKKKQNLKVTNLSTPQKRKTDKNQIIYPIPTVIPPRPDWIDDAIKNHNKTNQYNTNIINHKPLITKYAPPPSLAWEDNGFPPTHINVQYLKYESIYKGTEVNENYRTIIFYWSHDKKPPKQQHNNDIFNEDDDNNQEETNYGQGYLQVSLDIYVKDVAVSVWSYGLNNFELRTDITLDKTTHILWGEIIKWFNNLKLYQMNPSFIYQGSGVEFHFEEENELPSINLQLESNLRLPQPLPTVVTHESIPTIVTNEVKVNKPMDNLFTFWRRKNKQEKA